MARLLGIDIRATQVRAALLRTSYRKVTVERVLEVEIAGPEELEQALAACALPLVHQGEAIAIAIEGEQAFIHRITLPATALKQISDVLPYELEAQIPVDPDELVYDYRILKRGGPTEPVLVLVAAARIEYVKKRIDLVERVLGKPVERVGVGALTLANLAPLCPVIADRAPTALVDLGGSRTELVIVSGGEPVFARTLSRGVAGLPESAPALAAELRQTVTAWAASGGAELDAVLLVGGGASAPGAEAYLGHELGTPVRQLPPLTLEGVTPDVAETLPRFANAISIALGGSGRARDLDLRKGPLAFQRGFGILKEKAPLLTGLGVAIFVSFLFATCAEHRTLSRDEEVLAKALATLSKEVLGQETSDPEEAKQLLEKAEGKDEADPMPRMDSFDVLVEISKAIPTSITHDIEEFDMQRGHVKVNGVVGSAADAQTIAAALKGVKCFSDVKVAKVTQVVNSDRQKYVLEFDVKCQDEAVKKKKEGGAEPAPTSE